MNQFPIETFFSQKVYLVTTNFGDHKLKMICRSEEEATDYIKSEIKECFFDYQDSDIQNNIGSNFYQDDIKEAIVHMENYQILMVFGINPDKRIYKIISPNQRIYDLSFIVTNDLQKWKDYFKTQENPSDFYYQDLSENMIP